MRTRGFAERTPTPIDGGRSTWLDQRSVDVAENNSPSFRMSRHYEARCLAFFFAQILLTRGKCFVTIDIGKIVALMEER